MEPTSRAQETARRPAVHALWSPWRTSVTTSLPPPCGFFLNQSTEQTFSPRPLPGISPNYLCHSLIVPALADQPGLQEELVSPAAINDAPSATLFERVATTLPDLLEKCTPMMDYTIYAIRAEDAFKTSKLGYARSTIPGQTRDGGTRNCKPPGNCRKKRSKFLRGY